VMGGILYFAVKFVTIILNSSFRLIFQFLEGRCLGAFDRFKVQSSRFRVQGSGFKGYNRWSLLILLIKI
jgi:hypothetical protein